MLEQNYAARMPLLMAAEQLVHSVLRVDVILS